MTNAKKFEQIFGIYATELWAMPEEDFLKWLNAEAETKDWTPCSEGLPKIADEYLVTYHPCYWGEVRPELKVGFDSFRGKTTWAKNKYQKVVAWKEKPDPYLGDVK